MSDINTTNELPPFLFRRLCSHYGEACARAIAAGSSGKKAVTLRVNSLKCRREEAQETLSRMRIEWEEVPWYRDALVLPHARERELEETELYRAGKIYLQSLSSMLPPLFLGAEAGEEILDMTAAPGGKTTQLYCLSGGLAHITACEKDAARFARLKYNLARQGATRVNAMCADALRLDEFLRFDKILLDAPCSGSGTLDTRCESKISERLVENSAVLQKKLLSKALRLLKKGGTLVYSTCSVLPQENEEVVAQAEREGGELVPVQAFPALPLLPSAAGTVCVCPTPRYEGFFLAKIVKH